MVSNKRLVLSDEDCADCLCRVCARNEHNDAHNEKIDFKDCEPCEHCKIGESYLVDISDDCPRGEFAMPID